MLTEREYDVLRNLHESGWEWHTPLDIGGHCRSHHSPTLAKLVKRGLAESKQRSSIHSPRGSKIYKITEKGTAEIVKKLNDDEPA